MVPSEVRSTLDPIDLLRGAGAILVELLSEKWVGVGGDEKYPVTPVPAVYRQRTCLLNI